MRLAPVPIYYTDDEELASSQSGEQSRTTHGAPECVEASQLFGEILVRALRGSDNKSDILIGKNSERFSEKIRSIADG